MNPKPSNKPNAPEGMKGSISAMRYRPPHRARALAAEASGLPIVRFLLGEVYWALEYHALMLFSLKEPL